MYDRTNCVDIPMLIADLRSDTMEFTWIPRRGRADVVPAHRSLLNLMLSPRRSSGIPFLISSWLAASCRENQTVFRNTLNGEQEQAEVLYGFDIMALCLVFLGG